MRDTGLAAGTETDLVAAGVKVMTEEGAGTRFVGRERELDELSALLDRAIGGRGRLVLVGGEPGIGKSRLASELSQHAAERGVSVLWGRGWEDAGAPPYWPWVQAFRAYIRSAPPDEVRRHLGAGAVDIAQMLPELRDLVPDIAAPPDAMSDSARFRLFDSTTTLLRNASQARPILIVLDDLQSADAPSILLLRFLATQLDDMAVMVLGTYRDVELTPVHPLTLTIERIGHEPGTRLMALTGLAANDVAEYIGRPDRTVHDPFVTAVWRATNGNPLFIGEAVRLLTSDGELARADDPHAMRVVVPPGVRAVIGRRIGKLDPSTIDALTLAAVIGPEFGIEVLRRVADMDRDTIQTSVEDAAQAGLLLVVPGSSGRYRFSHDLVRETLYDEVAADRRRSIHRRLADVLEERYLGSERGHLAELAFHFVQAVEHPFDESPGAEQQEIVRKAIDYARRAGDEAARSVAYEEAIRLYAMCLAVMEISGDADPRLRADVLLARGDVESHIDLDAARASLGDAADIAKRIGDGVRLARAAHRFGGRQQWARAGDDTRLIPMLQDALVMLGGADERLRARLLTRLAGAWRMSPERQSDCDSLSRQAVDICRGLGDRAELIDALVGRFWATFWPDNPEERVAIATETRQAAAGLGEGDWLADVHFLAFVTLSERGRIVEARHAIDALGRVINDLRQPAERWIYHHNLVVLDLLAGDFAAAEVILEEDLDSVTMLTPAHDNVSTTRMHRFLLRRDQGRITEEEATIRSSVVEFPWYPVHRAALVCMLADTGRTDEARAEFDDLAREGFGGIYRDNEWLLGISLASDACASLGDTDKAAVLYEQLAPYAGRHAIGHVEGSVGMVDRYLGLLASTTGDLDRAIEHFEAAIDGNDAMGARPWSAYSQHELAIVLRRRNRPGDLERADDLDRSARSIAATLGMALADRIVEIVARSQAAVPNPSAATFRLEGEYWTIEYAGDAFRVRDSRGMRHLSRLLRAPGRELHALELAADSEEGRVHIVSPELELKDGFGDAGVMLDAEAKAAYRLRLADIRAELGEAERWNDPGRVALLEKEERALTRELAVAVGLGGRDRVASSAAERARVSVTRAIRSAMGRIGEQSPALADHLEATIRTGTFCSYTPDPRAPIDWAD
jgi:tetratricopeptide (TPR) repeat protein